MDAFFGQGKGTVLIIEDDAWLREALAMFLESEGFSTASFPTAEEGMDLLEQRTFHFIFSDYRLPAMDGLEFFKRVGPSHPETTKFLMTAHTSAEITGRAQRLGVAEVIHKPFDPAAVEALLEAHSFGRTVRNADPRNPEHGRIPEHQPSARDPER